MHAFTSRSGFRRVAGILTALAVLGLIVDNAPTATITWTNPGAGDFTNPANWGGGVVPGSSDRADVENVGSVGIAIINASENITLQRFELAGPVGTAGNIEIHSGGSLTTTSGSNTYVGSRGTSVLTIEDGASFTVGPGPLYVGWQGADPGAYGDGTVIQQGGTVTLGLNMDLGYNDANTEGRYEIHGGSLTLTNTGSGYLQIGRQGTGTFIQTGGTVTANRNGDAVMVGGQSNSTGRYEMSGASSVLDVPNGMLYVGANDSADGTFIQNNGTVTVGNALRMATNSSSTSARYEIHNGTLTVGEYLQIGRDGTATFVQTGGTVNVNRTTDALVLGSNSGATGSYEMSGGVLNVPSAPAFIGHTGTGTFTQTAGDVNIPGTLYVAYSGSASGNSNYAISGGTLAAGTLSLGNHDTGRQGTMTISGTGSVTIGQLVGSRDGYLRIDGGSLAIGTGNIPSLRALYIGHGPGSDGAYTNSATATPQNFHIGYDGKGLYTQTAGSTTTLYGTYVGYGATGEGTLDLEGGTFQCRELRVGVDGTGTVNVAGGATVTITGSSVDSYVGENGTGTLNQTGGTLTVQNRNLVVGNDGNSVGTYNLSGAGSALNLAGALYVGNVGSADGTFIQNDGTVSVGSFVNLGSHSSTSAGHYEIHGGTLTVPEYLQVGRQGTGTMLQTGGVVNVNRSSDSLQMGSKAGSIGTYRLEGGTINTPNGPMFVGHTGTGTMIMSGGTINAGDDIMVGHIATGTFTQTGGTVQVAGRTTLGSGGAAVGELNLSNDAQYTTNELMIGNDGTGTVTVADNAQLNVTTGNVYFRLGERGHGTIIQTGGTVTQTGSGAMYLGFESDATGIYQISGGTLDQGSLTIGGNNGGTGIFTQSGGDVVAHRDIRIGRGSGGDGSYRIDDGTLTVSAEHGGDGGIYVGRDGSAAGTFEQTGGTVTLAGPLILGNESGTTGSVTQSGGTMTVNRSGDAAMVGYAGTGTYTMDGGTLDVPNGYLCVGNGGTGTFIQNGGDVSVGSALRMAVNSSSSSGHYEIHGGTLTVDEYLQVGRNGIGTFLQTGGTVTVLRTNDAVNLGDKSDGRGTYTISGGTLDVVNHALGVGVAGTGRLIVLGSAADIDTNLYRQNGLSTLETHIDNGGITRIDVAGAATIGGGAMLDVDIYGGVALTTSNSFELLRTATAGNISGTLTQVDPEANLAWSLLQDGTVVQATLSGPSQGTFSPGYGGPLVEVQVNGGLGENEDYLALNGILTEEPLPVLLDVIDDQGDLDQTELEDLAAYIASAGQTVTTRYSAEPHWLLDFYTDYDLALVFDPQNSTGYFAWDFSDYDPAVLVTGVALGVPEPSTLVLAALGLIGLLVCGWRKRRRR